MSDSLKLRVPLWKRILFTEAILEKSDAQQIAYIGVVTAFCIVSNLFELKFATTQFSLTIFSSILAGLLIGPLLGFWAVFLGDGIGYILNSGGFPYYWWVALSVATMALISGLIMRIPFRFRGSIYVKLSIICLLTFILCTGMINSLGMYYLGLPLYMPKDVLKAATEMFGGELTFGIYLLIRFFILGQIWNSVVNYILLFIAIRVLKAIKPLKLDLK